MVLWYQKQMLYQLSHNHFPKYEIVSAQTKHYRLRLSLVHTSADSAVDSCVSAEIEEIFYLCIDAAY